MRILFLGTAAAEGFPATFCNCEYCRAAKENLSEELRTRSQMLVDSDLLIDFPADSFFHMARNRLDFSAVKYLLVTHSHSDHFYAQELINRGYKFARDMRSEILHIYGNAEVEKVFLEGTRREMRPEVAENVYFHKIKAGEEFAVGGYRVLSLPAKHCAEEDALVYCVEKKGKTLLYLNDTALPEEDFYLYLTRRWIKADAVSFDCTLGDEQVSSLRHMSMYDNCRMREKLEKYGITGGFTKYYVTHFSHNCAPFRKRMDSVAAAFGLIAAHDGLEIEL